MGFNSDSCFLELASGAFKIVGLGLDSQNKKIVYNRFHSMFKRIISVLAVLSFAVWILFTSLSQATTYSKPSYAAAELKFTVSVTPVPTITPQLKIEYFLAYPGVLPDSPLYKIKMIRDQIVLWLTTDAGRRAELFLLYADKRIGAGKVLIEGNQVPLGISTLTKGAKYLERAIEQTKKAKTKGKKVDSLEINIKNASLKYEEILAGQLEKVNSDGKTALNELLKSLKILQEKAHKF